mgnify:CR=1 FL=1|jgi:hypothetical protein
MSTRTRKIFRKKREIMENKPKKRRNMQKLREIKKQIEFETDYYFLESLKLEFKDAKNQNKLQRRIWRKKGWREYTV